VATSSQERKLQDKTHGQSGGGGGGEGGGGGKGGGGGGGGGVGREKKGSQPKLIRAGVRGEVLCVRGAPQMCAGTSENGSKRGTSEKRGGVGPGGGGEEGNKTRIDTA